MIVSRDRHALAWYRHLSDAETFVPPRQSNASFTIAKDNGGDDQFKNHDPVEPEPEFPLKDLPLLLEYAVLQPKWFYSARAI